MCKLCGSTAALRNSHIVPKFVGRWMKSTAPIPYMKFTDDIDRRAQDLPTMRMLCDDCESRFSGWETKFANEIFHPHIKGQNILRYRSWLVKFATSLTWRAIQYQRSRNPRDPVEVTSIVSQMEEHLSRYLLGQERSLSQYSHHIYPLDILDDPIEPGSPMLNRYLTRTVQTDIIRTRDFSEVLVYVKLPMFMFLAVGESRQRKWLETSRIKKASTLHPKDHALDVRMLEYMLKQSNLLFEASKSASPKSRRRTYKAVQQALEKEPDKIADSKWMEALASDYYFYGKDALLPRVVQ